MSTALYRRYRPESFADVIGQEHVTEPLMQALRTGRVNHAYLFSGPRGCGKTTSARILARCLNCEQGPTPVPCGVCDSCVALARGGSGSIDVIEIDAASHGGVEDARDLRERASYGPALSRYKVYIIDEAHMVTTQGFNALLKIVEEPPEHVKFIFATTEPDKVIGTIRSRTHHYPFRLVPPLPLHDYLGEICASEKVTVAPGVLSFVIRAGGGSVRDSLSVLDQLIAGSGEDGLTYENAAALLGFTDGELLDATIDGFAAGDGASVFRQVDKVIETGHDPRRFVEDLLERLRDLIVVGAVPEGASSVLRGIPQDQLERMLQQSAAFGPGALSRSADIVNAGLSEMTGATAPRLQLELICARLLLPGASGESGYAARLDRLERRLEMTGTSTSASPSVLSPAASPTGARRSAPPSPRPPDAPAVPAGKPDSASEEVATTQRSRTAEAQHVPTTRPTQSPNQSPPASTQRPVVESPVVETPAVETRRVPPMPGGIDTDAIRRSWPDVLTKIATISRVTWSFVSQNTRVLDYNGERLLLGLTTDGLLTALRGRNHAEVVRQALIEVIGVDTKVEGVLSADAAPAEPASADTASADPAPVDPTPARTTPARTTPARPAPARPAPARRAPADPVSIDAEPDDDWNVSAPSKKSASAPTPPSPPASNAPVIPVPAPAQTPATDRPSTPRQRARAAVAQEASSRRANASASIADDSVASADDENIEEAGDMGQPVIERVLGGMVIGELDQ
ncbi:MAG: DNA polymerase III subunit gamma and tau [Phycicoccus sp.]|nr:DNA polymerase III subunit gamma and tau [Phycicoccus sp.]NMM34788.1 DNA polymerase III subunit gamma and tau [Phycicoccus sp.]